MAQQFDEKRRFTRLRYQQDQRPTVELLGHVYNIHNTKPASNQHR